MTFTCSIGFAAILKERTMESTIIEGSSLTVPNDLGYLPAIQAFVSEVMERRGYSKRDTTMLLIALEEAIANVVKHAFEPGEKASYQIIVDPITAGIRIIIKDKGLPYSPHLVPQYVPPSDIETAEQPGLGSHLIKHAVDEILFHNLGREGKELHLVKYLPYRSIEEMRTESELAPFPEPVKTVEPPEKKDFYIRRIRPSEVYDVSKLFYRAYGYSYGIDTIYYPEKLAERHEDGTIISVVTVTPGDERVVGHAALVRDDASSKTAEAAMAVVEPGFRGQGCQSIMITKLVEEARAVGLAGIYSKAVTNHIYAQKAGQKAGFKRCAVVAGLIPADRSFKGIQAALSQRESVAYGYRVVDDPGNVQVFPPAWHRDMIEKIYSSIGVKRVFFESPPGAMRQVAGEPEVKVTVVPTYQRAVIEVKQYGEHTLSQVSGILKNLCYQKMEQITLYLNLEDPITGIMCGRFEELGFFFAGVLPFSHVGDALLLQYLNNVPIDYSKIKIVDEVGQEILAYVESCDPNRK
jgi:anti-sigma regulatory factor (Ser/Thr protein kinase)/GNAT superfamily N-acetyltransferase